ncbi:cytochrome b6-f complex subunit PetL [Roseofilum capinflatum]|jgi:hypothetical protein|uniref:Cytochrome b6-f complex subunit 6 n=1 Tax=Roseofilum capinflatum BLCC-M114 TaxID=3022440 RepID=A0ABT7BB64_9CYAN|nr:cytochrome b6-f complex subunit PetL [Roseofilum capinflatum]MDJ1176396.1 cytochrome b6-f complex subunit PetL [Roseofilum capinflatum BLCC-M114]
MSIGGAITYFVFLGGMIGVALTLWFGLRAIKLI